MDQTRSNWITSHCESRPKRRENVPEGGQQRILKGVGFLLGRSGRSKIDPPVKRYALTRSDNVPHSPRKKCQTDGKRRVAYLFRVVQLGCCGVTARTVRIQQVITDSNDSIVLRSV